MLADRASKVGSVFSRIGKVQLFTCKEKVEEMLPYCYFLESKLMVQRKDVDIYTFVCCQEVPTEF